MEVLDPKDYDQKFKFKTKSICPKNFGFAGQVISAFLSCFLILISFISIPTAVFKGDVNIYIGQAMTGAVSGNLVIQLFISIFSRFPTSIIRLTSNAIPLMVTVADKIKANVAEVDIQGPTLIMACSLCTLYTGIITLLMSIFKLGKLIYYIPAPVRSGAFAVIGFSLYLSSYSITFDKSLSIDLLKHVNWAQMVLLHVIGIGSYFYQYTYPKPYNLPVLIVTVSCVYHIIRAIMGTSVEDAQAMKWLMKKPDMYYFWDFYSSMYNMKKVDWPVLLRETPDIIIAALIGPILNTGINTIVVERSFGGNCDLNASFRLYGIACIVGGFCGGFPSSVAVSSTSLHRVCGGTHRISTLFICMVMALVFFYPDTMSVVILVPRFIMGGVFVFMGLEFLWSAIYKSFWEMTLIEYLTIWVILITGNLLDASTGILIGIIIAFILHLYKTANTSFITSETDNRSFTSNAIDTKTRASGFQKVKPSKLIKIYRLTGYIFFAPSYDICDQIKNEVKKNNSSSNNIKIQHVVIDFSSCSGFDSTAATLFADLTEQLILNENVHVGLVYNKAKRREKMLKLLNNHKKLSKRNDTPYNLYTSIEQASTHCEFLITSSMEFQPIRRMLTFKSSHWEDIYKFFKSLRKISKVESFIIMTCFKENLGKFKRFRSSEVIYVEYKKSNGIYFIIDGEVNAVLTDKIRQSRLHEGRTTDYNENEALWSVKEPGSLIGKLPERHGVSLNLETLIADTDCFFYFLSVSSILYLENNYPYIATGLYNWEREMRMKKMIYLKTRIKYGRD